MTKSPVGYIGQNSIGNSPMSATWGKGIIYRKISMSFDDSKPKWDVEFFYHSDSGQKPGRDVSSFAKSLFSNPVTRSLASPPPTPLDIEIDDYYYIVFELDSRVNWQFRPKADAITTKSDHKSDYDGLVHVIDSNTEIPGGTPPGDGCRIIYFAAKNPVKGRDDRFNLHVEFTQNLSRRLELLIDPDIKNTGPST